MKTKRTIWRAIVATVVVATAAVGCSPAPLPTRNAPVEVLTGTSSQVEVVFPEFDHVADVTVPAPANGVSTAATGGQDATTGHAVVTITATADLTAADVDVALTGHGCLVASTDEPGWTCPQASLQAFDILVAVAVTTPTTEVPDGYDQPDPERWEPQTVTEALLPGEVSIVAADGVAQGQMVDLVGGLGGGFTGADIELGFYQVRFDNVDTALAALAASPLVMSAGPVVGRTLMPSGEPEDWGDDRLDATWTFRQIGAPTGWSRTTGSQQVEVGIVDWGIYSQHSDLALASYEAPWTRHRDAMLQHSMGHGTHVAGTMCLPDGNGGLVGMLQHCRLHALELDDAPVPYMSWEAWVSELRRWLERHPGIRVVNFSGTMVGAHPNNDCTETVTPALLDGFARAFERMDDVLWVIAAGNCKDKIGSYRSSFDHLPAAVHSRLPNVIAVSATGRASNGVRTLAPYSVTDGTIAAPGGTVQDQVWSTLYGSCRWWRSTPCPSTWWHETRAEAGPRHPQAMIGTSMAAPLVAATAGLMLSLDPDLRPNELKDCLVAAAVTPIEGQSIRELWVPAALNCASPAVPDGTIVPAGPPDSSWAQWSGAGRFLTSIDVAQGTDVFVVDRETGTTSVLSGEGRVDPDRTWSTNDGVLLLRRCSGDDLVAVQTWAPATGQSRTLRLAEDDVFSCWNVAMSADGRYVSLYGRKQDMPPPPDDDPFNRTTYIWDRQSDGLDMVAMSNRTIAASNWAPVGHKVLGGTRMFHESNDAEPVIYDVDTGGFDLLDAPQGLFYPAALDKTWSPDGRYVLLVTDTPVENNMLHAYDVTAQALRPPVQLPGGLMSFGTTTWVAGAAQPTVWLKTLGRTTLNLWEPGTGTFTALVDAGTSDRIFESISPSGTHGAWQVEQGSLHIYDVASGQTHIYDVPVEGTGYLEWPTWSDRGDTFAFRHGHEDPRAFVWTADDASLHPVLAGNLGGTPTPVQLSPDGRFLAVIDQTTCCDGLSGNLRVWDRTTEGSSDHLGWTGYAPWSDRWWSPATSSMLYSVEENGSLVSYTWNFAGG